MRCLFVIIALTFSVCAWSADPAEHKAAKIDNPQQTRKTDNTESSKAISPINISVTEGNQSNGQECCKEKDSDHEAEWWTAGGTTALAVITFFLAVFTYFLWRSTADLVRRSDEATKTIERAYVKMSHHPPGVTFKDDGNFWIATSIKNFGKTPATITKAFVKFQIKSHGEMLPDIPDYSVPVETPAVRVFLVAGEEINYSASEGFNTSEEDITSVKVGTKELLVYGYVDYIDKFGSKHRAGYGRVYSPVLNDRSNYLSDEDFVTRSNLIYMAYAGYNYDREEN